MNTELRSLQARVAELERLVAELRGAPVPPAAEPAPADLPRARPEWKFVWDAEFWLNRLGIGLLLFGVAFLFKLSIDMGWITPVVRVGFGAVVGSLLLGAGLWLRRARRFASVLLGGGIATYYIVGFAASQLYGLVGASAAFAATLGITLLALGLAAREDEPGLAVVGALGGLGTPLLLYTGSGSVAGLVGYLCAVLAWVAVLFAFRGWRLLYWTAVVGTWTGLAVALQRGLPVDPAQAIPDRWLLQAAVVFSGLVLWILPLAREIWPLRRMGFAPYGLGGPLEAAPTWDRETGAHVHVLSVATPVAALALSYQLWGLSERAWGLCVLGVAAVFLAAAGELARWHRPLADAQLLAGVLLAIIGVVAALDGDVLLLALAGEAAALHLVSRRTGGALLNPIAHVLWAGIGFWLLDRLGGAATGLRAELSDLVAIGLALAVSGALPRRAEMLAYRLAPHAALLGWLWRALADGPNGAGYVTVAWGIYAVGLLVAGYVGERALLQRVGVATLLLVVAKLFLVDLSRLEALWRILLFMGFGGGFLFLSFALQGGWKRRGSS